MVNFIDNKLKNLIIITILLRSREFTRIDVIARLSELTNISEVELDCMCSECIDYLLQINKIAKLDNSMYIVKEG